MAGGRSNRFFVIGAVNVNESVAGVGVVLFHAVEPEDTRENKIVARRRLLVGRKRDAAAKHRAARRVAANLFADLEFAERGFHAAFFRAQAVARGRDRITGEDAFAGKKLETLVADGNPNGALGSLHLGRRTIECAPMAKNYHVAIVGATGAVGIELLRVMERRNFPVANLRLLASPRSAGKEIEFRGEKFSVEALDEDSFTGIDLAFFSAGSRTARQFAPIAQGAGAVVIDNSSAFRMDADVPLIIPEINSDDVRAHRGIIANPNCTPAVALMALYPLHRVFGLKRVFASSYQAVSGSGARAIAELKRQVEASAQGDKAIAEVYPHPIAFNVLPQVDSFLKDGYTREEMKMQNEGRKMMHLPEFRASVTCVRVPVYRAHSVALSAEFERPVSVEAARKALSEASGIDLIDEPLSNRYPTPLDAAGKDNCQVGRIRLDCALENGLALWVVGDQLLKGAALNAVQIAELL